MQEMMDLLGLDGPVLLLQIVAFVVLYIFLRKFLFGPVGQMMESRREEIQSGLSSAEEAREEREQLRREKDKIMNEAREEGRSLMQKLAQEANAARERLLAEAQAEREATLERGREMIETERRRALEELRGEVADLALRAARRAVREATDEEAQRKAVDSFISKLEAEAATQAEGNEN